MPEKHSEETRCKFIAVSVQRGRNEGRIKGSKFGAGRGVTRGGVSCSRATSEQHLCHFGKGNSHHCPNSHLKDVAKSPQAVCEDTFALLGLGPGAAGLTEVVNPEGGRRMLHRGCYKETLKGNKQLKTSPALSDHTKLSDAGHLKNPRSLEKAEGNEARKIIFRVMKSSRVVL